MPITIDPTEDQVLRAICSTIAAGDPLALVIPRWLPVEDGDDPSELRSSNDVDANGRERVHAWMVEQTSPLETTLVGSVPFDDQSGEMDTGTLPKESAIGRRLDCLWTYKIGLWYGYEQGTDSDNSTVKVAQYLQTVTGYLAMRPKLGLGSHVQGHDELQTVRAYTRGFDQTLVHVRLNILPVRLYQTISPSP